MYQCFKLSKCQHLVLVGIVLIEKSLTKCSYRIVITESKSESRVQESFDMEEKVEAGLEFETCFHDIRGGKVGRRVILTGVIR